MRFHPSVPECHCLQLPGNCYTVVTVDLCDLLYRKNVSITKFPCLNELSLFCKLMQLLKYKSWCPKLPENVSLQT